jgi:selenocysteine-specific elongation factor
MGTRELILGTAGHIDHGKTALVRALTGIDTDRLEEERERGISIDIGFAHLDLNLGLDGADGTDGERLRLGIVDVPGHERFIRNMLAGATGIDVALLVVAADDSIMPQTREHLEILQLLGIRHGLIAITKADLVGDDWLEMIEAEIRETVAGTFLDGAPIITTSVVDGRGLDALRQALSDVCAGLERRPSVDAFRLAIDRSFVLQGLGTVVTGTVWSGRLAVGDEIAWLPAGRRVRVRGLQMHGTSVDVVEAGQRAAVNLADVHHTEIHRGHEIAAPGFLHPARCITVELRVLPDAPWAVRHRAHVRLHIGTQELIASVRILEHTEIEPGGSGAAQLVCAEPAIAVGRQPLVIRAESPLRTLGGGVVLHPDDVWIARRDAASHRLLPALASEDAEARAEAALRFHPMDDGNELDLCRAISVERAAVPKLLDRLERSGRVVTIDLGQRRGRRHLHRGAFEELAARVVKAVERLHEAARIEPFVPRARLLARLDYLEPVVIEAVVHRMVERGDIVPHEGGVALAGFHPTLTHAQRHLRSGVLERYLKAGWAPPDAAAIAATLRARESDVRTILDLCVAEGHLVHVDGELYLHRKWVEELRRRVVHRLREQDGLTVSEIKTLLETSRKYAVPICEYLDRVGVTKRAGDVRVLA